MKEALIKGLKSDEWYTPLETVKTMLEIFPPPKGARVYFIWCVALNGGLIPLEWLII